MSETPQLLFAVMEVKAFHDLLDPSLVAGVVLGKAFKVKSGEFGGVAVGVEDKHGFEIEDLFDLVSATGSAAVSLAFANGAEANAFIEGALHSDSNIHLSG